MVEVSADFIDHGLQFSVGEEAFNDQESFVLEVADLPVIKAIAVAEAADFAAVADYEIAADILLFDAKAPEGAARPGGRGAAFDWQLLAERLCEAVDGLLPEKEKSDFLLKGQPPLEITKEQFQELIGTVKYRQYLNH